jgi:hypothetical protein
VGSSAPLRVVFIIAFPSMHPASPLMSRWLCFPCFPKQKTPRPPPSIKKHFQSENSEELLGFVPTALRADAFSRTLLSTAGGEREQEGREKRVSRRACRRHNLSSRASAQEEAEDLAVIFSLTVGSTIMSSPDRKGREKREAPASRLITLADAEGDLRRAPHGPAGQSKPWLTGGAEEEGSRRRPASALSSRCE